MDFHFTDDAAEVNDWLDQYDPRVYNRLWDVLESVEDLGEEAKQAPWVQYVSSYRLWGTQIPATDYTVFWRIEKNTLYVASILHDLGI